MEENESDKQRQILCTFFVEVLGVEQSAAEEGVIKLEASVSREVRKRMAQYASGLKRDVLH